MANTGFLWRRSIFRGKVKDKRHRVQGILTPDGLRLFMAARVRVALLSERPASHVSDADTIEYLARGHDATRRYIENLDK